MKLLALWLGLMMIIQVCALAESDSDAAGASGEDGLFFSTAPAVASQETAKDEEEDAEDAEGAENAAAESSGIDDLFFSTGSAAPSANDSAADEEPEEEPEDENGVPQLSASMAEEDWNWAAGRQTTVITLENSGTASARDIVLQLTQPEDDNGRVLGEAVFYKEGSTILTGKKQTDKLELERIRPGETLTYTVSWIPAVDLVSVDRASLAVFVTAGEERLCEASVQAVRNRNHPGAFGVMLVGSISVGHVLIAMACITVLLLILAFIRHRRWERYRNTWVFWPKGHRSEDETK